jgi:hypothetical protein
LDDKYKYFSAPKTKYKYFLVKNMLIILVHNGLLSMRQKRNRLLTMRQKKVIIKKRKIPKKSKIFAQI